MYFNKEDISMYYEKHGNSPQTILILPGWGDNRKTFYHLINYFKEEYTIYIVDYPGFGNSVIPNKDLTIYDYTNYIRELMTNENIKDPIIIAHSFGGRIATLLTGYYKEKISKLILIDTASIKPRQTLKGFIKKTVYKILKNLKKLLPKNKREVFTKKLLKIFGSKDYQSLPNGMHQTFKNIVNENLKYYIKDIESETLIIWGEKDQATPLKDGIKFNSLIKDSALIIYPNRGHFSYLEEPYLTNKIIENFIK